VRAQIIVCIFFGALALAGASLAQNYPTKPIRIVTSDAGGGGDIVARTIAPGVSAALGQPIVVDNRSGGVIAGEFVAKSAPDGHTLILYGNTLWILPLLQDKVPYDTLRDFAPITLAVSTSNILVIHPALPVKSVKELIALARSRPGELNYASAAIGTSNHLAAELFKAMARVNIVRIPYKGLGAAITDVLSGHVAGPHVHSGRLRALAVSSAQRSKAYPQLPTIAEAALPGYESSFYNGVLAPAATPDAIIRRLNQDIVRALNATSVRERFDTIGVDVVGSTPEQFAAKMKAEIAGIGKVIRDAGIRGE
jgi:tripartite-type tricarboxylate transporter receptor subunit TctC